MIVVLQGLDDSMCRGSADLFLIMKIQVREIVGAESRELNRYKEKMEERARQEEELFTRAPLTNMEKKKMKHLKKSRNGYAKLKCINGFRAKIIGAQSMINSLTVHVLVSGYSVLLRVSMMKLKVYP